CAVTGGTISVANRRSTRQAQLWPGTGPCCDEEYDRTKLNSYRAPFSAIPILVELGLFLRDTPNFDLPFEKIFRY
ncbi:hypothetical protein, partial [Janthinobacterium sp.]|uniref:hypothetical protein n=1 Tax=Janthinobacterium sp. TaxID=1871054 RepID=UPI0026087B19